MRVFSVESNRQRLDGGAMFGHCPRALWSRWCEPDELGRIELATRGVVVIEDGGRVLLFEAGIGDPFPSKERQRYGIYPEGNLLLASLAKEGIRPADVDVVVLSHLHFDHAGGLLLPRLPGARPELAFPRAQFVVSRAAWERALSPRSRDRASFLPELCALLAESGRLVTAEDPAAARRIVGSAYRFAMTQGHTPGLLHACIPAPLGPLWFLSDLVPGRPWLRPPITMGYDRCAEELVEEKTALLEDIVAEGARVIFVHDPDVAVARPERDDRGGYVALETAPRLDEG